MKDGRAEPLATPRPAGTREARWVRPLLVALLLWSLLLRAANACQGLDDSRFFDERFSLANVLSVLTTADLRPANAYYPSLSYLPQAAVLAASQGLYRLTGVRSLSIFLPGRPGVFGPTGYLLARLVQAVFGVLSIFLTFLVGRRLFSPQVGLLGALLLSVTANHLRLSVFFKPDVLVVALTLAVFLWSLDAAERPSLGRFLLAGVGIGLAVAAKYTGVVSAIPLAVAAVFHGRRDRRPWLWLGAAGLASIATFLILNPHLGIIFRYLPKLQGTYIRRAVQRGRSHLGVVVRELRMILSASEHGRVVGAASLLGLVGLGAGLVQRALPVQRRLARGMCLAYVLGLLLLYAAATGEFKENNFLSLFPFTSLAAAWLLITLWRRLTGALPEPRRRRVGIAAWGALVALLALPATVHALSPLLPTTADQARRALATRLRPVELRVVYYEEGPSVRPVDGLFRAATVRLERLDAVAPEVLDRADAEVFAQHRLEEADGGFYLRRVLAVPLEDRTVIAGPWWKMRGPPLVVLFHPWQPVASDPPAVLPSELTGGRLSAALPPQEGPELLSFAVWMPRAGGQRPHLALDHLRLPLLSTRVKGEVDRYATLRFVPPPGGGVASVELPAEPPPGAPPPRLELLRWRRAAAPPGAHGGSP